VEHGAHFLILYYPPAAQTLTTTFLTPRLRCRCSCARWEEASATLRQMRRAFQDRGAKNPTGTLTQIYTTVLQLMVDSGKTREALEVGLRCCTLLRSAQGGKMPNLEGFESLPSLSAVRGWTGSRL
jgi:hypothetical protein